MSGLYLLRSWALGPAGYVCLPPIKLFSVYMIMGLISRNNQHHS